MNRGFSLVQVLISLGLMGLIFVAGFQIFESQTKLGKSSSFVFESMIVLDEIKSVLSDPLSCKETFSGKSIVFDEITSIEKFENSEGTSTSEYLVSNKELGETLYGQNNILIESIGLYGDREGFKSMSNYSLVQINFKEVGGSERYTGLFPLRVFANELGRIEGCQSTPGLHLGTSGSSKVGPWVRVSEQGKENGIFSDGLVSIGAVAPKGRLNGEGGALFWTEKLDSSTCVGDGLLIYSQEDDALFVCQDKKWLNISHGESLKFEAKEFNLEGVGAEVKTLRPEGRIHYCLLKRMQGAQGECRAQRLEKGHWELLLNATPGHALKCEFSCF